MDELRYHTILKNDAYQALLQEAEQARLVARIRRGQRGAANGYPAWLAYLLARLSKALIDAGTRLQSRLNAPGSQPQVPCEQLRQYSYGD